MWTRKVKKEKWEGRAIKKAHKQIKKGATKEEKKKKSMYEKVNTPQVLKEENKLRFNFVIVQQTSPSPKTFRSTIYPQQTNHGRPHVTSW